MEQLSIRGFGKDLERKIQALAKAEGISLNKAVLRLLRKGAGLDKNRSQSHTIGSGLNSFMGTWSQEEYEKINEAISDFEDIDSSLWS